MMSQGAGVRQRSANPLWRVEDEDHDLRSNGRADRGAASFRRSLVSPCARTRGDRATRPGPSWAAHHRLRIVPAVVPPASRPAGLKPIAEDRYRISFTASAGTYAQFQAAKELLSHAVPSGDPAEIIHRALTLLVAELSRKKFGSTERPRAARTPRPESRYIPAALRRAVRKRDAGRCAFVGREGHRCEERSRLEFHHVTPFAEGGQTTFANLELRCRAHNAHEADVFYAASRAGRDAWPGPSAAADSRCHAPSG
jgi:hypothetical protein